MGSKLLDICSDYLICQNKYATATELSDLLSGDIPIVNQNKDILSMTRNFVISSLESKI